MSTDPRWTSLAGVDGWARLLAAARRSLERSGGSLNGSVSLSNPTEAERLAVIGVSGGYRSPSAVRLTVRLQELDNYLRGALGGGLADVLGSIQPLRDRPGETLRENDSRAALVATAQSGRYGNEPWHREWLEGMRRDGTLTRVLRGAVPFEAVVRVLDALPAADEPLPVLADRVLSDTKALSDGPVRGLVLRALSCWFGLPAPASAEQERSLWELAGVVPDDLASQVLVLNLPVEGGLLGDWMSNPRSLGVPIRLTLQQLRLAPLTLTGPEVFVCENPAVLRAAAAMRPSRPLVCTEGVPSTAVHTLLRSDGDYVLRWRNDFDWTGIRLTASALTRYPNAVPWRMTAADHAAGRPGPPLLGTPAPTTWDPSLSAAMSASGRAVMEESLLDRLLADLHP